MLVSVVVLIAGCRDGDPAAVANHPATLDAGSADALAALGPGWRVDPADPHACFVSLAAKQGSIPYLYRRISLHLPASVQALDGAVAAFRVRDAMPDGRVTAVLNCVIPATFAARRLVAQSFGVPLVPIGGGATMDDPGSCVSSPGETNPCPIKGITATSKPVDSDPCVNSGTCYYDPGTGGGWTPTFPSDGGGDTGGSGGTDPCTNCGPNAPIMSCTAVARGATTNCSVNTGDANVASWVWTDGTNLIQGPGNTAAWSGTAVASGTVSVYLTDGTTLQGELTVSDRGWTWAKNAESTYTDGTGPSCIDHTPTYGVRNGVNLPMGATDCDTNERMIQPDSYDPAGDGFQAQTVPDGPNRGLHYIASAKLYLRRQSTYNRGMLADAAPVSLAGTQRTTCGDQANWDQFTRCMGDDPDAYVQGAHYHEGYGSTGHNGHFSAAYDAVASPGSDLMEFLETQVGETSLSLSAFTARVRRDFQERAGRADIATMDLSNGGTIVTGNYSGPYWGWLASEGRFSRSSTSTI